MNQPSKQASFLVIISILTILGCTTLIPPAATATPIPTRTSTLSPTDTPAPTSTKPAACNADQTLRNLKSALTYDESVLFYNQVEGTSYLAIWFVDPELDPAAEESEISANTDLATRHGLILSQELKAADSCVDQLFDWINAIVVDKNYNGWLSAQVKTSDLPATVQTDDKELDEIANAYEIGYLRAQVTAKTGSAPANSCSWAEAQKNIRNHFSSERENVAFYYVLDDAGVNVWAQWDSDPEFAQLNLPASLMNIAMEIDCLFPQPDRIIFNVVDETGEMQIIGLWNGSDARNQDIGQIQILYQK